MLDFGSVISKSLFETINDVEQAFDLDPGTLHWHGPFAPEQDNLWRAMQAGEISERNYWARRCGELGALIGRDLDMIDVIRASRGDAPVRCLRPEAVTAIDEARRLGALVAILSNELELFYGSETLARIPLLTVMDHIEDATHTGILKPDPRAYERAMSALNVTPDQVVFVDDQMKNVRGAQALGIYAVHFDVRAPAASFQMALDRIQHLAKEELVQDAR